MTPLGRALRDRIRSQGPISVELFMEACNSYYYSTRDPIGLRGDFTTAPEVSQLFGEMIGAALAGWWKAQGAPGNAIYTELGPGRGTLAKDALRVLRFAGFDGEAHFVETSPVLRKCQERAVPNVHFHRSVGELPDRPMLLIANEFLDALPVRQFIGGTERCIVNSSGGFAFDRDGEIIEDSPSRDEAVHAIAKHLIDAPGVAIIIDYGHSKHRPGDTLQAVSNHQFANVLERPGEQDLTAHVDFEAIGEISNREGALVTPVLTQGEWLLRLGIEVRAEVLSTANPERAAEIKDALVRLTDPNQMGKLFKVIAVRSPGSQPVAGFQ